MRLLPLILAACAPDPDGGVGPFRFPAPDDRPALRGPGGPSVPFPEEALWEGCAPLFGGEGSDHHNLVLPYRGHLVMPWAPEWGGGGISLFDVSDPCAPVEAGIGESPVIRETHAMGFVHLPAGHPHAGDWAATNWKASGAFEAGLMIWDLSDPAAPEPVAEIPLDGSFYPDSYRNVTLSLFWQYPWLYAAAADAGVFVIDAFDPRNPEVVVEHFNVPGGMRVGGVFALGSRLLMTSAEQPLTAIADISDPREPRLFPGAVFDVTDRDGVPREYYHGNLAGHQALFARKSAGGGAVIYDISDPSKPTFVGDLHQPDMGGGYIFRKGEHLFVGNSHAGHVIDASDPTDPKLVGTGLLPGDLDTITPYGNVAVLAVDDDAVDGIATVVMPWTAEVDADPPRVLAIDPSDGAIGVPVTARIGVGFDEFVEPSSVFAGSIRLWDGDEPVPGWGSAQENTASYAPAEPLRPGATYRVEVLAGGITDVNGNAVAQTVSATFKTAP